MRRALVVSPYFLPINLAGVHRARLLARGLPRFGWEPIILTVDARQCEEPAEPALVELLPKGLRIESVGALPARICRPLGIGDVSLRGYYNLRRRIADLMKREKIDLIFVTVLPGYAGMLGAWAKREFNIPFVLDYQDPWVSHWGATQSPFSKAGLAHRLATWIEPGFVKAADAITAVSDGTLDTIRERHLISADTPIKVAPIGCDIEDYAIAREHGRSAISKQPGVCDIAYLGTVPERKLPALRIVLKSIVSVAATSADRRPRLHLIGTSAQPDGKDTMNLRGLIAECGASEVVRLEPRRIPYLDALRTMQEADILQMLGSIEAHYTGSKIFPYWLADKPIISMGHRSSPTGQTAAQLGGVRSVTYGDEFQLERCGPELACAYSEVIEKGAAAVPPRNPEAFDAYSALGVSQAFASVFDQVRAARGNV